MTELLTPKTERVKKRELSLPHQVAGWAQVALMMWVVGIGEHQLPIQRYYVPDSGKVPIP